MFWAKILITGWTILVVAVAANYVVTLLGISSWYPFINEIGKEGLRKTLQNIGVPSIIFLFVVYPLILGFAAYFALRLYR